RRHPPRPPAEAEGAPATPAPAAQASARRRADGRAPAPAAQAESAPVEAPALKAEPSAKDRELTEAWQDPTLEPPADAEPESLGWTLIRTLLVLGAVVASIYLTLNVGLRRLMGLQAQSAGRQPLVSVVERLPLDQRRSLFVVKAADEYLLVGGGEAGLQLLSKLDAEAVERIRAQRPQTNVVPLSPFLQKLLSRRSGGSPSQPPGA
ncbi:FliO/MopB family protein, partial [Pyxidicoccus sp. 3LFB2]